MLFSIAVGLLVWSVDVYDSYCQKWAVQQALAFITPPDRDGSVLVYGVLGISVITPTRLA